MKPYHLTQLAALCRSHPVRSKVVFVPTVTVGYNLISALAVSGQACLNLRMMPPAALARQIAGPQFDVEGRRSVSQDMEAFYLEDVLARAVQEMPDSYFSGLSMSPGLVQSFLRTVQSLRLAGVGDDSFEGAGVAPGKVRLLAALCRAYSARLAEAGCYDDADLYVRATEMVQTEGRDDDTVYAILDETSLSGLAFRFVRAVTGGRLYRIGRGDYGVPPPAHSAAVRFPDAPFPEAPARIAGGGRLLLEEGLSPEDGGDLELVQAVGVENEVRGALREILRLEMPLDEVEIAYTVDSPYLGTLCDAAECLDVPAAFSGGIPVTLTRPGQALAGFYRWIGSGFEAGELIGMCRAGLIRLGEVPETDTLVLPDGRSSLFGSSRKGAKAQRGRGFEVESDDEETSESACQAVIEPYHLATILQQSGVVRGRGFYLRGLDRLLEGLQERARAQREDGMSLGRLETERARLLGARRAMADLLSLVPEARTTLSCVAQAGLAFLNTFAPVRNERDGKSRESLENRLREIADGVDLDGSAERLAQRLGELVSAHRSEASAARPGHLYVAPLERAGYTGRKRLYVLGMDEGAFPGGATEDAILLDDERSALSGELLLQHTRPREHVWHLVRALGMAGGAVTLLTCCRDLVDGRETYPSALFQQAAEQLGRSLTDVPTVSSVPESDRALGDVETMLGARRAEGFEAAVRVRFPWLVEGQTAALARAQPALTRFDGWLGRETPELDVAGGNTVLSASRLEMLTACPYRYFLRYVLGVEPPDEAAADPTRWLTPLEYGELLHDLFCDFMRTLKIRGESPDGARHAALLKGMLDRKIAQVQERIPAPYEAAYRDDCGRLARSAEIFLAEESRRKGADPVGFEVSFGSGREGAFDHAEAVCLNLSARVRFLLRGRIDRVDRRADGYEIWDYKTGSARAYDETDVLRGGMHLQWALYAHALDRILEIRGQPDRVLRSGYFFVSDREYGRRIADRPPERGALAGLLEPLFDLVSQGCFFHVQRDDHCTFCDYNGLCAGEQRLASRMKEIEVSEEMKPEIIQSLRKWLGG